jgi:LEA14-like dessication related protein
MHRTIRLFSMCLLTLCAVSAHAFDINSVKKGISKVVKEIPKPSASLKNVDITSISFTDIHFLFTVSIKNPYPIGINLDKVLCNFNLEKIPVFSAQTAGGLRVPGNGAADTQIEVVLAFQKIIDAAKTYSQRDRVDLQLAGDIVVAVPEHAKLQGVPASIAFPFSMTKAVPTIKPSVLVKNVRVEMPDAQAITAAIAKSVKPQVSVTSVQKMYGDLFAGRPVSNAPLDFTALDLVFNTSFDVELKNETPAALLFKSLNYGFAINGEKALNGQTAEIIPQGNTSLIKVKSGLSSKSLGTAIVRAFQNKKADYTLTGTTFLTLPAIIKPDPLKLEFSTAGVVNF